MDVTVSKWGNSSGIRIPAIVVNALNIHDGDVLEYEIQGDTMILKKKPEPVKKSTKQLYEDFYGKSYEDITDEDIGYGEEIDWGEDVGGEVIE